MANSNSLTDREMESYVDADTNTESIQITLSTAGTVTTVNLSNLAKGFRLYPRSSDVRFSVNETVTSVQSSSATSIAASSFGQGGIAKSEQWETRLLSSGTGRFLTLISATSSVVVELEVF
jgi:hypothetical protein